MAQQKDVRHSSEQGAGRETAMSQDPSRGHFVLDGRQVVDLSEWPWRSRLCPLHRVKPAPQGHHPGGPLRAPASHPKLGAQDSMGARLGLSLQRDHAAP